MSLFILSACSASDSTPSFFKETVEIKSISSDFISQETVKGAGFEYEYTKPHTLHYRLSFFENGYKFEEKQSFVEMKTPEKHHFEVRAYESESEKNITKVDIRLGEGKQSHRIDKSVQQENTFAHSSDGDIETNTWKTFFIYGSENGSGTTVSTDIDLKNTEALKSFNQLLVIEVKIEPKED